MTFGPGQFFVVGDVIVAVVGFSISLIALVISVQNMNLLVRNKRNGSGMMYAKAKVIQESLSLAGQLFFLSFSMSLLVNISRVVISTTDAAIRAWLVLIFTGLFTAKSATALYAGWRVRGYRDHA